MSRFVKATKGKKPVRIVLGGPSGSGKTYTALLFAKYLASITGKPTAAIDTEHYRMSLYADKFDFNVDNWEPPFNPKNLTQAIKDAEEDGFGQLIVDSSTHFYSMEGGLLEVVQNAAKTSYGGNQYAGWAVGTPIQNELIDTVIRSPLHIIFCTRAKQGYLETEKANGRGKTYEKAGMELQQRDGFEYDFDFSLMMDMENNATVSKGMGYLPTGEYVKKPDAKTIELIMRSINENTTDEIAVPHTKFVPPTFTEMKTKVESLCKELSDVGERDQVIEMIKKYDPDGKLPHIKDVEQLVNLYGDLTTFKTEKENN